MRTQNRITVFAGLLMAVFGMLGNPTWARAHSLIGNWATSQSFGDVVDAGTGATLRASYTGQAFRFRKNGTYQYVLVGSGTLMTGVVVERGKYVVKGSRLYLRHVTQDWSPSPSHAHQQPAYKNKPVENENFEISFKGADSLLLVDLKLKTRTLVERIKKKSD